MNRQFTEKERQMANKHVTMFNLNSSWENKNENNEISVLTHPIIYMLINALNGRG